MKHKPKNGIVSQLKNKYCNLQYELEVCFRYKLSRKTMNKIDLECKQILRKIHALSVMDSDLIDISNSDYYKEVAEKLKLTRELNC